MPMIVLDVEYTKPSLLNLKQADLNLASKQMLQETAAEWHDKFMPRHFTPGNTARYRYAIRGEDYLKRKQRIGVGQGKYVSLVLSGRSKRAAKFFFKISGTARQATLTMQMPTYFVKPFIGNLPADPKTGKQRKVTQQPDKVRELTTLRGRIEPKKLALFAVDRYVKLIQKAQADKRVKSKG